MIKGHNYYDDDNDDYDDVYDDYDDYDDYVYDYNEGIHYYNNQNSIENKFRFDNKTSFTKIIDSKINPDPLIEINARHLNVLMIAEKPSIAKTISKILSENGYHYKNRTKENDWCLYEYDGIFKEIRAHFVVSSVAGHMYQTEFLRMHQNFDMDPCVLFDVPTVKTECDEDSFITADWLKYLAKDIDILCLWLDCDGEGENICYEVIHNVLPYMNKKDYQQIYRAIFSSLTKEDITKSFQEISNYPDNNLSLSIDAREVIDLKVGVSLTRFLTSNILPLLPDDLDANCISYGPCQTPTLWFCVNRQKELEKQDLIYYKIYIKLKSDEHEVKIYLQKDYKDFREVREIINDFRKKRKLIINNLIEEKRTKEHPPGLNTANMLKMSSTYLGISPQATMNIAERLYTRGYISYPRTETTQYASSFNFKDNLNEFKDYSIYGDDVTELIEEIEEDENDEGYEDYEDNEDSERQGYDAGDHPPNTPARKPEKGELKGKELELFNLICQYYFASLSQDLEYENLTYEFEIDGKKYTSSCSLIKNEGYLKFLPSQKKEFIDEDDVLQPYQEYQIVDLNYERRQIDSYITEAELIEEMEKNHIGTDASMSVHIANIVRRGYVRVDDKRRLIPTRLGKALIEALEAVEPDIVLPKNRATIERFVSLLSEGKKNYDEVLNYALKFYKSKYISVASQIGKLIKIFGKYFKLKKKDLFEDDDDFLEL